MAGSLLCAVHCALLPIAFLVLPATGLALLSNGTVELAFVVFATVAGLASLLRGYLLHRAAKAMTVLLPGVALLWTGILWAPVHEALVPHALVMAGGGSLVAVGHYLNLRLGGRRAIA